MGGAPAHIWEALKSLFEAGGYPAVIAGVVGGILVFANFDDAYAGFSCGSGGYRHFLASVQCLSTGDFVEPQPELKLLLTLGGIIGAGLVVGGLFKGITPSE